MRFPSSQWELLLHNLEEGVVAFDHHMHAIDANKAALRLLGLRSVKGFPGIQESLVESEIRKLVLDGVEVLNVPLTWNAAGEDDLNILRSFIPVIPEDGGVQGVILLLKPELASSISPVENWLEWGRKYLTQVTSNLYEAICYLDREGRIIYTNQPFEELAGGRFQDISGKPLPSVLRPVSRPLFLMEVIEKTLKDGSWHGEFEIQTAAGRRSLLATAALVRSDEGVDLGMAVLARDITERKHLERETQRHSRELSLVYDLLELTAGYHDMEEALRESLSRILNIMRAEAGAIYLRDWASENLRLVAYQGLTYRSAKELASGKEGLALIEKVMANSRGLIIDQGGDRGGPHMFSGRRGPLLSLAAVPVSSRDRSVGLIMVGHKQSAHFGEDHLSVLLSLASQVGVVFELAGLMEDLREKLEELGQERDFSRALVDTMPSALALLDNRGRFFYVNQRFTELLGYLPDGVEGQPFTMLLPSGERKKTIKDILNRERIGSVWREAALIDRWGEAIPVLITYATRPFEGGEYSGAMITITDLSRQRAVEREMEEIGETARELGEELAGTRDSLQSLDARKQAYLSMVHHEVTTPLKLIRQRLKDLDQGLDGISHEEARARLDWLEQEINHLERLASDIRDVSAVERGMLRLRRREADMRDITMRAVEEMYQDRGVPVNADFPEKPVMGRVDAGRVEQVLQGLIDNAMKFSKAGSEVGVRLSRDEGRALWEVRDKGSGMDSRQVENLMDLFAGKGSPEVEIEAGLGLFVCHHIVQAHGGEMRLESEPGKGTKVYLSIPLDTK